ncbi:hypothetical protein EVAR_16429_1 [Eumeta japonica]|uniref:Uncharacterized protein n=1 Tax=Eumeta variegata TaxID=151549 RepID=A0A4C1UKK5_EUMVA|nr:hypothetical protein EVAR_16429_1 [Eumeta japonica]
MKIKRQYSSVVKVLASKHKSVPLLPDVDPVDGPLAVWLQARHRVNVDQSRRGCRHRRVESTNRRRSALAHICNDCVHLNFVHIHSVDSPLIDSA